MGSVPPNKSMLCIYFSLNRTGLSVKGPNKRTVLQGQPVSRSARAFFAASAGDAGVPTATGNRRATRHTKCHRRASWHSHVLCGEPVAPCRIIQDRSAWPRRMWQECIMAMGKLPAAYPSKSACQTLRARRIRYKPPLQTTATQVEVTPKYPAVAVSALSSLRSSTSGGCEQPSLSWWSGPPRNNHPCERHEKGSQPHQFSFAELCKQVKRLAGGLIDRLQQVVVDFHRSPLLEEVHGYQQSCLAAADKYGAFQPRK